MKISYTEMGVGLLIEAVVLIVAILGVLNIVLFTIFSIIIAFIMTIVGIALIILGLTTPKQRSDRGILLEGYRYPNINIWDAETIFHDYRDDKTRERDVISKKYDISVKIANGGDGSAREPYWAWRLTLDSKKIYVGKLKNAEPKIKIGASFHKISYIPQESQTFYIKDISGLDDVKEREMMKKLEIWVVYPTKYRRRASYQIFYNENGKWITNKPTRIYWVKK